MKDNEAEEERKRFIHITFEEECKSRSDRIEQDQHDHHNVKRTTEEDEYERLASIQKTKDEIIKTV